MTPTSLADGVRVALRSINANRLTLLLGAGLSMPSGLPSAWTIAARAKQTYDAQKDPADPPLSPDIEEQADFFHRTGDLEPYYIQTLVDNNAFAGQPNKGHVAVADFLLTGAARSAVSANYDILIEAAGLNLHGSVGVALDGAETTLVHEGAPLLKIHGCWVKDKLKTVWTPSQLNSPGTVQDQVVQARIALSESWLATNLPNSDLVVVGFWSDWSYLNSVIGRSLGQITPPRVVIVDPGETDVLIAKAPDLTALGDRAPTFLHVQESGEVFLDALREAFSRSFLRQILHAGTTAFAVQSPAAPDPGWLDPEFETNDDLWQVRRDIEGCPPNDPAKRRTPPDGDALGLAMLTLQALGARPEGPYWRIGNHLVRIINGNGRTLHAMKQGYDREMTQFGPTMALAIGADDSPLPGNAGRPNEGGSDALPAPRLSFVRSASRRWVTSTADIPAP